MSFVDIRIFLSLLKTITIFAQIILNNGSEQQEQRTIQQTWT